VTGPRSILEGEDGFLAAFAPDGDLAPFETLGRPYAVTEAYRKPYACCRHVHGPIDAALDVRERVDPDDVARVRVETYTTAAHHDATAVDTTLDAQMSVPYGVAVTLVDGRPGLDDFAPPRTDAAVTELLDRIEVVATDGMDRRYPDERPSRTVFETADGERFVRDVAAPTGAANDPMSRAALRRKYDELTVGIDDDVRCRAFDAALGLSAAGSATTFLEFVAAAGGG